MPEDAEVHVIDDSPYNLEAASRLLPPGTDVVTHLVSDDASLHSAIVDALDVSLPGFTFDTAAYLKAKAPVDSEALHRGLFESLIAALTSSDNSHLTICDLGCGLLPVLSHLTSPSSGLFGPSSPVRSVEYHAYESNLSLLPSILSAMSDSGYAATGESPHTFFKEFPQTRGRPPRFLRRSLGPSSPSPPPAHPSVTVYLHMRDFRVAPPPRRPPT